MKKKFTLIFAALAIVAGANAQKLEALATKSAGMAVAVDGILDEAVWQTATTYSLDSVYQGESFTDAKDCSAFFQVAWNEEGIFVAVTVTDDVNYTSGTGYGPAWNFDMVEIYFDTNVDDLNDSLGGSQNGNGHFQNAELAINQVKNWKNKSSIAYKLNDTGYVKETFVSWSDIPDKNGTVHTCPDSIGFDMYIIDDDADSADVATGFRNRLVWSNTGRYNENWSYMNDAGILKFDTVSANVVENEFVTVSTKVKGMPIVVDGALDEPAWGGTPKYRLAKAYNGEGFTDADDCSAYFQTLYTDAGIYIAVSVTDDINYTSGTGYGPVWNFDMVEIYFDTNVGELNDSLGGSQNGNGHFQQAELADDGIKAWKNNSTLAYKLSPTGYVKETFVNWSDIKDKDGNAIVPSESIEIGFDMYVIDDDADSADVAVNFRNRLVWSNNGDYNENWSFMDDAGILKFDVENTIFNTGSLSVYKVDGDTILIDGLLEESIWDTLPKAKISQEFKGEGFTNANDCSGYFQTAWNNQGIYIAVTVTDDVNYTSGTGYGPAWNFDMVEIYFDTNVGALKDSLGGSQNGNGHYQNAELADSSIKAWKTNSTIAYRLTDKGYVKETFVSWADLKDKDGGVVSPAANIEIGFDVYIIDDDADSADVALGFRNRLVWANWGDYSEDWSFMDDAGILKLSGTTLTNDYTPPVVIGVNNIVQNTGNAFIYPNPAKNVLNIGNVSDKVVVNIFSVEGKKVMQSKEGVTSINISSLQKGIYLVRITDQNNETIKRVLIQ